MPTSWFSRRRPASATRRPQARSRRPLVEALEGRQLLATFSVTNVNDAGPGSLRQAILSANATTGTAANTINFAIGSGLQTISPKSALPTVTHALVLDATTQPGTGTTPRIALDGTNAGAAAVGLTLRAPNVTVKGFAIDAFAAGGVLVDGASNDTITNDFIGVTPGGNAARGNGVFGVELKNAAAVNTVSNDVISANAGNGVVITGKGTSNNVVSGDFLGTDSTGTVALANTGSGVVINLGATNNTVGGTTAATRDVISGNKMYGVYISDSGTSNNLVAGDYVGTDVTSTLPLGNAFSGVAIGMGASGNTVGGTTAGARVVSSANGQWGVSLFGTGTTGNLVEGDYVGTDATGTKSLSNIFTGTKALGNGLDGVRISGGATNNTIGGTTAAARNIISGNRQDGVKIDSMGTTGNTVAGNDIGTDVTGTNALGNGVDGVGIALGAARNLVGGTAVGAGNVISRNNNIGVNILDSGTTGNTVAGNDIGTDATGTKALGNWASGVVIATGATGNLVGGTTAAARNIISGNGLVGIFIANAGTTGNLVEGNDIGTDVTGTNALGNRQDGVAIGSGATNNTIGGTTAAARNIISGNGLDGVFLRDAGTTGNLVEGNYIGTDVTGTNALGNALDGVYFWIGANGNTIGGTAPGAGNVISGNADNGVIFDNGSTKNVVAGNIIGLRAGGEGVLPNGGDGVLIANGSSANTIGGTAAGSHNVISGNGVDGVQISNPGMTPKILGGGTVGILIATGTTGNTVAGNYIGTDANGTKALGNTASGVVIATGATGNIIGGTTAAARNIISGNTSYGVFLRDAGTTGNVIAGNFIGTNLNGFGAIPNGTDGVLIQAGASANTIGGPTIAARNVISGNGGIGVHISGAGTTGNVVEGAFIGVDATGETAQGNGFDGVRIDYGATNNLIGGTNGLARNVISGNRGDGVVIRDAGTSGNMVEGNYIGTDATLVLALGNGIDGVGLFGGASNNQIGGSNPNALNYIEFNALGGVLIYGAGTGNLLQHDVIDFNGFNAKGGISGDGVQIGNTSGTSLFDLTIESNQDWGIDVLNNANTNTFGRLLFANNGRGDTLGL